MEKLLPVYQKIDLGGRRETKPQTTFCPGAAEGLGQGLACKVTSKLHSSSVPTLAALLDYGRPHPQELGRGSCSGGWSPWLSLDTGSLAVFTCSACKRNFAPGLLIWGALVVCFLPQQSPVSLLHAKTSLEHCNGDQPFRFEAGHLGDDVHGPP